MAGVTHPLALLAHGMCTRDSSYRNDSPISDTNAMMIFSMRR